MATPLATTSVADMSSVPFLSDEWLTAVDEALATLAPTLMEQPITIEYQVTGGPRGDQIHQITIGPEGIRAHRPVGEPTITLSLDWGLAFTINQGTASAQSAFLDGRIRLAGDPSALLSQQHHLGKIDDLIASVRVRTTDE